MLVETAEERRQADRVQRELGDVRERTQASDGIVCHKVDEWAQELFRNYQSCVDNSAKALLGVRRPVLGRLRSDKDRPLLTSREGIDGGRASRPFVQRPNLSQEVVIVMGMLRKAQGIWRCTVTSALGVQYKEVS